MSCESSDFETTRHVHHDAADLAERPDAAARPKRPRLRPRQARGARERPLQNMTSKLLCVFLVVDSTLKQGLGIDNLWARTRDAEPHFDGDLLAVVAIAFYHMDFATIRCPNRG